MLDEKKTKVRIMFHVMFQIEIKYCELLVIEFKESSDKIISKY